MVFEIPIPPSSTDCCCPFFRRCERSEWIVSSNSSNNSDEKPRPIRVMFVLAKDDVILLLFHLSIMNKTIKTENSHTTTSELLLNPFSRKDKHENTQTSDNSFHVMNHFSYLAQKIKIYGLTRLPWYFFISIKSFHTERKQKNSKSQNPSIFFFMKNRFNAY